MPHQCLQCGHLVPEDASSQLLQGCPTCKGTRFFFTDNAIDDGARKQLASKTQKDLRQVVADMLQESAPGTAAELEGDGWKELKPKDLRKLVKRAQSEASSPSWENPDVEPLGIDVAGQKERVQEEVAATRKIQSEKPETVEAGDGSYGIDVRGLLEKNPIVVHKDGAYMIHLASLFDQKENESS